MWWFVRSRTHPGGPLRNYLYTVRTSEKKTSEFKIGQRGLGPVRTVASNEFSYVHGSVKNWTVLISKHTGKMDVEKRPFHIAY